MDYYPVVVKQHPRTTPKRSPESKYWRRFRNPVFIKDTAPVTSIHFSPSRPHQYAVTSGAQIQVFAPKTQKVVKTIARFKNIARSANIRSDGKLVVAGDDSGLVQVIKFALYDVFFLLNSLQVFDINSRAILRTLDVHKQPTHVTKFSPLDPTHILTCSDDTTIRLWDMPSQTILHTFTDHTDYVRSGLVSPSNPALILTGSYDCTVRLWDTREGSCVMTMRGGGGGAAAWPVEGVLMFPSGSAALSASGPILRVWDLVAGGRCVRAMSNHQKTVTALAFDGRAGRLLTGGLDQMVKVYDVSTYKVVHTMKYPAPVLSLAISVSALYQPLNLIQPLNLFLASLMIPISQLASTTVLYPFVDGNQKHPKLRQQKQSARLSVRTRTNFLPPVCWGTSESGTSNRR